MLHEAAKVVVRDHAGKMPLSVEVLETLPGVGHYTARAVAAFAGNQDVVFVETNLRTAVIHHFFPEEDQVDDTAVLAILEKALPPGNARVWYGALMDYGAHLKRSGVRVNAKSKGYAKQSTFTGSGREARGGILRALSKGRQTHIYLLGILGDARREQVDSMLEKLVHEGLVEKKRFSYQLPA
jgi:A/G-specific adenine glycosylase